jgi:quercetin dioxygenase-like cupin family protein
MTAVAFIDLTGEILTDPRGISFFPFKDRVRQPELLTRNFHLVSIEPGQVRGNHAHPGQVEWLYPFHGHGEFLWQEPGGAKQERRLAGGRVLIRITPGVAHAMRNPGPEVIYLLAWREPADGVQGQPDTVPQAVV